MTDKHILSAAIVVDMRTIRCGNCKVAIHDDLAVECPMCGAQFDSIVSNHVGMAARLEETRTQAGVKFKNGPKPLGSK